MGKLKLGPMTEVDFSILKESFNEKNISFERTDDTALFQSFYKSKEYTQIGKKTYAGSPAFIYVEFANDNLLLIKPTLDHLGLTPLRHEKPQGEDYICPKCKFASTSPGKCPEHNIDLLNFDLFYNLEKSRNSKIKRVLAIPVLIIISALLIRAFLSLAQEFWN